MEAIASLGINSFKFFMAYKGVFQVCTLAPARSAPEHPTTTVLMTCRSRAVVTSRSSSAASVPVSGAQQCGAVSAGHG